MKIRCQPKGGMCVNCQRLNDDCTKLPFRKMEPVIGRYCEGEYHVLIVKCTEFKRNER